MLTEDDRILNAFEKAGKRRAMAVKLAKAMGWAILVVLIAFWQLQSWIGPFFAVIGAFSLGVGTFVGVAVRRQRKGVGPLPMG